MTTNSIVLLGTGTCQMTPNRIASSALISLDEESVVYDMGHGVCQRLVDLGLQLSTLQHIVISHFHPDHVSDLIPFLHASCWSRYDPRHSDLYLYGPTGLRSLVEKIFKLFEPRDLTSPSFNVHCTEIQNGTYRIGRLNFEFAHLPPANNHGIKFSVNGLTYALTGDSHYHDAEIDFLRGVDVAIIDAGHIGSAAIVELCQRTQVQRMICSHIYEELDHPSLLQQASSLGYTGKLEIAYDKMIIPF